MDFRTKRSLREGRALYWRVGFPCECASRPGARSWSPSPS